MYIYICMYIVLDRSTPCSISAISREHPKRYSQRYQPVHWRDHSSLFDLIPSTSNVHISLEHAAEGLPFECSLPCVEIHLEISSR